MRYERQELLIGQEGQQKLQQSAVAIIGIGALGTVATELLARSGIGTLILIDRDVIELSNLQRQTLFDEADVGRSKAVVAKEKIAQINLDVKVKTHAIHLNSENISVIKEANIILDCTDNMNTRFLINDFCRKNKIIWIYGAAIKTYGYAMPIFPEGPCLQCFTENASLETCDTVGVINMATTSIAALQSSLAVKILLQEKVEPSLYHYDVWNQEFKKLYIKQKEKCPTCNKMYVFLDQKENDEIKTVKFCGSGRYHVSGNINFEEVKTRIKGTCDGETIQTDKFLLFKDGRALIKANSEEEAISIYSRYIGN
ncbi:NAD(P)H-binding protein [Candidatus Woesearchaeota archaeon CG10_big_fil_rev_8_21_14_0_10_32_24]|nr:MAG: NAD(P)H-binding protein [Candidatus Woesearchaeota archaeon CG10_big_fil_rev_8_21_14_0_10_32_24]